MNNVFSTRPVTKVDRIKGLFFRVWHTAYATLRAKYNEICAVVYIADRRTL